jgi:predicted CXXCH cytochrome family protein
MNCHKADTTLRHPENSGKEFKLKSESPDLCLTCHNKTIKSEDREITNIKEKLKKKNVHSPVESGCTDCHNPHSSKIRHLLVDQFPAGNYSEGKPENYSLCFSCHDSELLTSKITDVATKFRHINKNLHSIHSSGDKGRKCSLCHDIHGSDLPKLIKEQAQFGNWNMSLNFQKNNNGGSCFPGCHKEKSYTWNESVKIEPKLEIANKPVLDSIIYSKKTKVEITDNEDIFIDEIYEISGEKKSRQAIIANTENTSNTNSKPKKKIIKIKKGEPKFFAFKHEKDGKTEKINYEMKTYISSLVKYMKKYPKNKLQIDVEVEDDLSDVNEKLKATEYCSKVLDVFVEKGISMNRIMVVPYTLLNKKKSKINDNSLSRNISFKIIN